MKASLKLSSAAIAFAIMGAGAPAYAQDAASGEEEAGGVRDIVVTATRRSEAANKIPVAIQALGGDSLSDLNITKLDKLVEFLPNVRTASRGPGASSIFIRGLSTDSPGLQIAGTAGAQPTVALYVNDAPASLVGRNLDVYAVDLQRVEVLAGPQGTLFGASAMGGALRYITNKPDLSDFKAGFNASYSFTKGGDDSVGGDAYVNVPIIKDTLGIRFVAYADSQGGYIDNVAGTYQMPFNANVGQAGRLPTGNPLLVMRALQACQQSVVLVGGVPSCGTSGGAYLYNAPTRQTINNDALVEDNYNDATYRGGRISLTFKPADDWSLDLMHMRQQLDTDGVFDYEPDVGDLKVTKFNPNSLEDKADLTTWTINGRLGMLDLVYTGSYLHHKAVQTADYAGYSNIGLYVPYYECDRGVYYTAAYNGNIGNTCYTPNKSYKVRNTTKRWTHEARITTPAGERIRGTLGVFYDVNKLWDNTDWSYLQPAAGFIYRRSANLGPAAFPTNPNDPGVRDLQVGFFNDVKRRDRQFAVYGEASFDIVPEALTVTGGFRYYNESASINGSSQTSFATGARGIYNPLTGTYSAAVSPPTTYGVSANLNQLYATASPAKYKGVLWKGNLTYKFDNSLVYVTYSDGFRPGGFNRRPCRVPSAICPTQADFVRLGTYVPDKVQNYEVGGKFSLLDRRMQINLAAYRIDWTNIQMTVFDQNISNQTFTTNLVDARIYGVEGDMTWRATPELTLNGAFSYNDSELTKYRRNTQVLRPLGSPLALSPKFQFNVRMNYEWETGSGLKPYINVAFHHVGSSFSDVIDNVDIRYQSFNPTLGYAASTPVLYNGVLVRPGDVIAPLPAAQKMDAYNTLSAAVGAGKDGWRLELFADNITNERAQIYTSANDGERRVTTNRPFTVGMRVSYSM
ncbi:MULTISPECIES: TonB-dependent receptor [unclassified Novosphingobium]|uniref:TonB-dependent receptor n=1 Tax=unclassified Novosphingobium TaxID=2644732 RepID=UPI0025D101FF|nr:MULTISPECIES: TonB-dependent receptor [unclassified Novosphingobium]HQV01954.1 TonB-dependent receptor [Novosphingobium sp.]